MTIPNVFILHDNIIDRLYIVVQSSIYHPLSFNWNTLYVPTTKCSSMKRSSRRSHSQRAKSQCMLDWFAKPQHYSEGNEYFHQACGRLGRLCKRRTHLRPSPTRNLDTYDRNRIPTGPDIIRISWYSFQPYKRYCSVTTYWPFINVLK